MTAGRRLSPFAVLGHRNFRLFFFGQSASLIGTWIQQVALAWLVLLLTDSSFYVGLVTALGSLPVQGAVSARTLLVECAVSARSLLVECAVRVTGVRQLLHTRRTVGAIAARSTKCRPQRHTAAMWSDSRCLEFALRLLQLA